MSALDVPETIFAEGRDGSYVAYQLLGDGPTDLVLLFGGGIPVEDQMEGRHCSQFIRRLAAFTRVIRFDRHGIGMSDPMTGSNTLEQWVDDALIVLDAIGSEHAAIFGADGAGSALAMMFAASHPERASRLLLYGAAARFARAEDHPWGWTPEELETRLDAVLQTHLTGIRSGFAPGSPSVEHDLEFWQWFLRARRRGLSPTRARAAYEAVWRSDLRSALDAIRTPTLLLYRRVQQMERQARYLAEHIDDARLSELPGEDGLLWMGDIAPVVEEVQEFVTGVRPIPGADRVLATVLFTDIVDSTVHTLSLGDRSWRERLDAHDAMVRGELARFRGREINTTGDGFLATFDGPARAIQCGCAIRDRAVQLGIDVRVGLHTGEIERRADDIVGISVNTAARVESLAQPGEVCVSRTVVDLVAGSGIVFQDRGEHELKGVPGSWRLFAVEGLRPASP